MTIVIKPLATPTPHKLAEAELCFDAADGLLQGLILRGIEIWESSERPGDVTVTLPTRHFRSRDGTQRAYPLLYGDRRYRDAPRLLRDRGREVSPESRLAPAADINDIVNAPPSMTV